MNKTLSPKNKEKEGYSGTDLSDLIPFEDIETYDDSRIKLYFLGNYPKIREKRKPELHFLAVPLEYEPEKDIFYDDLLYFAVSPFYFYGLHYSEGKLEEIVNNGLKYLILKEKDSSKEVIPPFESEDFSFKIIQKETVQTIADVCRDFKLLEAGERCIDWKTISEEGDKEHLLRKINFQDKVSSLYSILIQEFKDFLDTSNPLRKETLRYGDSFKEIASIEENKKPFSIGRYFVRNYINSMVTPISNNVFNPEAAKKIEKDEIKEFYGVLHEPITKMIWKCGNKLNLSSLKIRIIANLLIGGAGIYFCDKFAPEEYKSVSEYLIGGFFGLDIFAGLLNSVITYENKDIINTTGIIGSIREMLKKEGYYKKFLR